MTDGSSFGPAKAITIAMLADGVDLLDEDAVQSWIEAFNARPFEERDEFLRDRTPQPGALYRRERRPRREFTDRKLRRQRSVGSLPGWRHGVMWAIAGATIEQPRAGDR